MPEHKILVVEDEADIRELLVHNLKKEGFQVQSVGNGEDAIQLALAQPPDLVLLDWMLPFMNGLEVCKRLKANPNATYPILMVTARGSENDIVAGLEAGADDYVVKPFSLPVLMARVRRALSREHRNSSVSLPESVTETQGIRFDEKRHEVFVDGLKIDLTSSEFILLSFLANLPGWVYTRSQIVKAVHGENYPVTDRSVDVMVLSLRRKLGTRGSAVETVRGVGYRFAE
jgi:two-component system, OmpR family, alkaline phosphatase synthesis response regulator PhoP